MEIVSNDIDFNKRKVEFEIYFENQGFNDFEDKFGCSVEVFKSMYEQFKVEVSDYFKSYVPRSPTLYPLTAEICGACSIDFFATLESTKSMISYPAVSILKGEYYATTPRVGIEYKECEVVMKELLKSYFINIEFYEEMKKCAEDNAAFILSENENVGNLDDLNDDFPF